MSEHTPEPADPDEQYDQDAATAAQESSSGDPDEQYDQDAGPASRPTGAAAQESPSDDPDAGPASGAPQE